MNHTPTQAEGMSIATAVALAALDTDGDPHHVEDVFRRLAAQAVQDGHDPESLVVNVVVGLAASLLPVALVARDADDLQAAILRDLADRAARGE